MREVDGGDIVAIGRGTPYTHTVYILSQVGRSLFERPTQGSRQYYTGVTTDLKRRIRQHNEGLTTATKGIEWEVVAYLSGFTPQQAYAVERYLKRGRTLDKRAVFYMFADAGKTDLGAAQRYYHEVYPHIYRFLRKGYET